MDWERSEHWDNCFLFFYVTCDMIMIDDGERKEEKEGRRRGKKKKKRWDEARTKVTGFNA